MVKWWTRIDVVVPYNFFKRCLIIFLGQISNFKVTLAEISKIESILSKITRPIAAVKSLRFALFDINTEWPNALSATNVLYVSKPGFAWYQFQKMFSCYYNYFIPAKYLVRRECDCDLVWRIYKNTLLYDIFKTLYQISNIWYYWISQHK